MAYNKKQEAPKPNYSFDVQKLYRDTPKYIEGRTKFLEYNAESLEEMMDRFADGLRSSMSYFNARNLDEYRKNISFVCR